MKPVEQNVVNIPMPSDPAPDNPITTMSIPSLPPLELSAVIAEAKSNGSPFTKGSEDGEAIDHAELESTKEDSASSIVTPLERSSDSKVLTKDAALARDQFKHNVSDVNIYKLPITSISLLPCKMTNRQTAKYLLVNSSSHHKFKHANIFI